MFKNVKISFLVIVLFISAASLSIKHTVSAFFVTEEIVIILDAGHGGFDPGKVSENSATEKDINLEICLILKDYLEASGITTILTRETDTALGDSKNEDMKARKNLVNDENGSILVSIHQNAFPEEYVRGAQTFYYKTSKQSELLAHSIQNRLIEIADPSNKRVEKDNSTYYILKEIEIPSVIVECGFMSNSEEKKLLNTREYKEKLAWALYLGIIDYLNQKTND